jgi:hypothetical protein
MSNLKETIKAAQLDLIKELGIDKLNSEQKEKIITDIGEVIQKRIVIRIIEELPNEKQDEFQGLLNKAQENPELLDEFLKENIPDLEDMILEEIGEYKKGAVDFMKKTTEENEAEEKVETESVAVNPEKQKEDFKQTEEQKKPKETLKQVEKIETTEAMEKTENKILDGIQFLKEFGERKVLGEVLPKIKQLENKINEHGQLTLRF